MDKDTALMVAGVVFALVAFVHILRLTFKFELKIAGKKIPLWANWVGLAVAGGLSVWMFSAIYY